MLESDIMRLIQISLSKRGHRVLRNNVGQCTTDDGRIIRFGLGVGSSDLIGWTRDGRFLAVEIKTQTGRTTPAQFAFLNAVNASGGIGIICRREEDLDRAGL